LDSLAERAVLDVLEEGDPTPVAPEPVQYSLRCPTGGIPGESGVLPVCAKTRPFRPMRTRNAPEVAPPSSMDGMDPLTVAGVPAHPLAGRERIAPARVVKKTLAESISKSEIVTPGTCARTSVVPVATVGYVQTGVASTSAASVAVES
jgi:hypothetical protein